MVLAVRGRDGAGRPRAGWCWRGVPRGGALARRAGGGLAARWSGGRDRRWTPMAWNGVRRRRRGNVPGYLTVDISWARLGNCRADARSAGGVGGPMREFE